MVISPADGYSGWEIDTPELVRILKKFYEVSYIDENNRKPLLMVMQQIPGKIAEYTIEERFKHLNYSIVIGIEW